MGWFALVTEEVTDNSTMLTDRISVSLGKKWKKFRKIPNLNQS
jgi:hypothetical protein